MDNYRCYLSARVWNFMSSGQDFSPILFIPWAHLLIPKMETLTVAPLVTLVMLLPSPSIPACSVDLIPTERFILSHFFRFLVFLPLIAWRLILLFAGSMSSPGAGLLWLFISSITIEIATYLSHLILRIKLNALNSCVPRDQSHT